MPSFAHDGTFIPDAPDKDPQSVIDYGGDWSAWLDTGETIIASLWFITGTGATPDIVLGAKSFTDTATSVFLSLGVLDTEYTLTNRVTTSSGRTEDRSMLILCKDK